MNMNAKKRVNGSWVDAPDCIHKYGTSTDTFTTLPANIIADGTPLLDYLINGNTVQPGTPTPDSPVMPQSTGERTGNLAYAVEQGGITNTGDKTTNNVRVRVKAKVEPNTKYTFVSNALIVIISGFSGETFNDTISSPSPTTQYTFTTGAFDTDIYVTLRNADGTTIRPTDLSDVMLNIGSTALPYEPYGIKIPISSAGQTTPVYLGEVESTRRIKKIGVEIERVITLGNGNKGGVTKAFSGRNAKTGLGLCDRVLYGGSSVVGSFYVNQANAVFIGSPTDTLNDFKSKYNGASLWYVLAEPQTAVVNEPLMKIGDYADTLSMEQAQVSIPTLNGQTVVDVDTTLKPSEIEIEYTGWHPLVGHKRINGVWT